MELLTTVEAAKRIGLSPRSLATLVADGKVKAMRLGPKGGRVRFTPQALEEYLKASEAFGSRARRPREASHHRGRHNAS